MTHRNGDDSLRALERDVQARIPGSLGRFYLALDRVGRVAASMTPQREFEAVEELRDTGHFTTDEATRRHAERTNVHRYTLREKWLVQNLSSSASPFIPTDLSWEEASQIAGLMRRALMDPYGYNVTDRMEEIATILGSDRGGLDAIDAANGDPRLVYVAWQNFDRPTLFWDYLNDRFLIRPTNNTFPAGGFLDRTWDLPVA